MLDFFKPQLYRDPYYSTNLDDLEVDIEKFSYREFLQKEFFQDNAKPEYYFLHKFTICFFFLVATKLVWEFKLWRYRRYLRQQEASKDPQRSLNKKKYHF